MCNQPYHRRFLHSLIRGVGFGLLVPPTIVLSLITAVCVAFIFTAPRYTSIWRYGFLGFRGLPSFCWATGFGYLDKLGIFIAQLRMVAVRGLPFFLVLSFSPLRGSCFTDFTMILLFDFTFEVRQTS